MAETATFGAGCFWGVEAEFTELPGVVATRVGYAGGRTEHPTYQEVYSHGTGHAEVVEITFDPHRISYKNLLSVFWECHDPTQLNRQGPDVGDQYRSVVFYHSEAQREAVVLSLAELEKKRLFRRPIVTEISPAAPFWEAESYHQKYLQKHRGGCGF